jgi:carbon starvation protein
VLSAAGLAFATGADGKGAMVLWPLFGITNQLLAALALLLATLYLKQRGGMKYLATAVPCTIMLVITNWAMVKNEMSFIGKKDWLLAIIGGVIFSLALWMTIEALVTFRFKSPMESHRKQGVPT